jgi:hypothetical protein
VSCKKLVSQILALVCTHSKKIERKYTFKIDERRLNIAPLLSNAGFYTKADR